MRTAIALVFFCCSTFPVAFAQTSKITGHWYAVSTGDTIMALEDFVHSGIVTFERVKHHTQKTYQWGGGLYTGMEFAQNGEFYFYNNVLCSSESSPQTNRLGETWEMQDEKHLLIHSGEKNYLVSIVSLQKNRLVLRFTGP